MSSGEVKSAVAVHPARISQWRAEGEALVSQADGLAAFAALEAAVEPVEELGDVPVLA
jgi:hypothetical protein